MAGNPSTLDDIGEAFGFGTASSKKAAKANAAAVKQWGDMRARYNANPDMYQPGQLSVGAGNDPGMLHEYGVNDPRETAVQEKFLTPWEASAAGLQGDSQFAWRPDSAWKDSSSAFDSRGPSAYDSRDPSAYGDLSSAFGDVGYDQDALARMRSGGDYFANLSSGGSDPIADAQYARKVADAEASRRANTDAALAAEEARGAGSGSGRLLAELSNQQASVGDQYLAGLDANAQAAQRRDYAANQGANIGQMIGSEQRALDTARAQGLDTAAQARAQGLDVYSNEQAQGQDAYSNTTAQGQDAYGTNRNNALDTYSQQNAEGLDAFANNRYNEYYGVQQNNADRAQGVNTRNTARGQFTGDANVDLYNNAQTYNTTQRPGELFQQELGMTTGRSNAEAGAANTYQQQAANNVATGGVAGKAGALLSDTSKAFAPQKKAAG